MTTKLRAAFALTSVALIGLGYRLSEAQGQPAAQAQARGQNANQTRRPGEGRAPEFKPPTILEYKPKSRLIVPENLRPRAKYPVIDIHSHHQTPIAADRLKEVVAAMDKLNLQVLVNLSGGSGDRLKQGIAALKGSP